MKDFLGREIELGDQVAVSGRGEFNKGLHFGVVLRIAPKRLTIQFPLETNYRGKIEERSVRPEDTIKLEGVDVTYYLLSKKNIT